MLKQKQYDIRLTRIEWKFEWAMISLEVRMSFVNVCKTCNDLNYDLTTDLSTIYSLLEVCSHHTSQEIVLYLKN